MLCTMDYSHTHSSTSSEGRQYKVQINLIVIIFKTFADTMIPDSRNQSKEYWLNFCPFIYINSVSAIFVVWFPLSRYVEFFLKNIFARSDATSLYKGSEYLDWKICKQRVFMTFGETLVSSKWYLLLMSQIIFPNVFSAELCM